MSQTDTTLKEKQLEYTIVVVEDDLALGEIIELALQYESYHTILVTDGEQGLQMVQALKPHLLIVDYQLPGMNGLELYDHLKLEGFQTLPILFMSARLPLEELKKRDASLIEKPFEIAELLQVVEKLLAVWHPQVRMATR